MAKITILGLGGWGIGLAIAANNVGNSVIMWSPFQAEVESLRLTRKNDKLLNGVTLPKEVNVTDNITDVKDSDIIVFAVPSSAIRQTANLLSQVETGAILVSASKGFEKDSLLRLSQVIKEEMPNNQVVVLTGPTHAEEVSRGIPTAMVAASESVAAAQKVQKALISETLRIYIGDDIVGAEIGGAIKNVIAICAGFCSGMGLGDNTKAALITRGLFEMTRLGVVLGGQKETFSGLAGIGDLIVTCLSEHSRNNRFGRMIGQGSDVQTALQTVGTVEGYYAAAIVHELAEKSSIDLPIMQECYEVLYNGKDPVDTVKNLMLRPPRAEK